MTVNINIDVDAAKAFAKIWGLKGNLKQLESSFDDFDLDVDATLGDNIQELREVLETLNGGDAGLLENDMERARSLRKMMDGGLFAGFKADGGTPGGGGGGGGGKGPPSRTPMSQTDFGFGRHNFIDLPWMGDNGSRLDGPRLRGTREQLSEVTDGMTDALRKLKPSMRQWWALIAAIIPLLITFATHALGVAAAMGAVAVAGAALLGLGLIGHGEDVGEAFRNAREEVKQFGEDLFEVFQGPAQTFAPIQSEFFDWAPGEMDGLADSLEGLIAYESSLFDMWSGLTGWLEASVRGMAESEEKVSQLAFRFGDILGTSIIDFFGWLLDETHANQSMLIALGRAIVMVAGIIFNLSKAVSRLVITFTPLLGLLFMVTKLLNNKLVMGVVVFAATMGIATLAALKLTAAIAALAGVGIGGMIPMLFSVFSALQGYIFNALLATSVTYGFAQSIATVLSVLTLGVGAVIAFGAAMSAVDGMSADINHSAASSGYPGGRGGGGFRGSGGGGTTIINEGDTNINVEGSANRRSVESIRDISRGERQVNTTRQPGGSGS